MFVLMMISMLICVATQDAAAANPKVEIDTSKGKIVLELYPEKTPETVKNFLSYVDGKFYGDTIFHRVIPGFMIQGGGFTLQLQQKPTRPGIKNEADKGLKNNRGTIAMARTSDPHSATAQFFINSVNNDFLNFKSKAGQGWGYTAFGKVVKGMDVVDAISAVKTGNVGPFQNVPQDPVTIRSIKRLKETKTIQSPKNLKAE